MLQNSLTKADYWAEKLDEAPSHVLLVDDSAEDNFIHRRYIKREFPECTVHTVSNGQEALDFLLNTSADDTAPSMDLICLDVNMPVLNAWGFLKEYEHLPTESHANHIALMVSAELPTDALKLARKSPYVSFFLSKPFAGSDLVMAA